MAHLQYNLTIAFAHRVSNSGINGSAGSFHEIEARPISAVRGSVNWIFCWNDNEYKATEE